VAQPSNDSGKQQRKDNAITGGGKKFGYQKPLDYTSRAVKENVSSNKDKTNMELFYNQQVTNPNMSWLLRHHGGDDKINMCLRGIMQGQEDFTFNIQNDYSQGDESWMGDFLNTASQYARTAQKQSTMYNSMKKLSTSLETSAENIFDAKTQGFDNDGFFNAATEKLGSLANMVGNVASSPLMKKIKDFTGNAVDKFMNSHFMSAADVVRRYSGSTVTMNIPPLDVYIFHNPNTLATNVVYMVQAIIQQCLGDLSDAFGIIGLQEPPGGYKARFDVLNTERNQVKLPGTWSLTWGGYSIHNLLVTNVQVALSKFNAMDSLGRDTGDPLYAKLSFTLDKATYISRSDLFRSIVRTSVRYDKHLEDASSTIDEKIPDDNLSELSAEELAAIPDFYEEEAQCQSFTAFERQEKAEEGMSRQDGSSAESGDGASGRQNEAEMRL
jgi:hypothetical protein